jgi:hypothetical protein
MPPPPVLVPRSNRRAFSLWLYWAIALKISLAIYVFFFGYMKEKFDVSM